MRYCCLLFSAGWVAAGLSSTAFSADWPTWGGDATRNMVSGESGLPLHLDPGKLAPDGITIDPATLQGARWVVPLGTQTYGNPVVAGGRVYVGTNNDRPRDPRHKGDRGVLLCLEEETGAFLWQLVVPKLITGNASDWEGLGICSSPTVDGDRVYLVTNRAEVVCLDAKGLADGNAGPVVDEARLLAPPGAEPVEPGPRDADVLWAFDMRAALGVIPHNIASSSPLVVGGRVYATTSNGRDWTHANTPAPFAPALVCLDAASGALLGEEASGIGERLYHGSWSSPAYGEVGGRGLVFFGAGDGFCYAFEPVPVAGPDGRGRLNEAWRCDCNPPAHKARDGKPIAYPDSEGPSEIVATPVFHEGRVYVAVGQDPEQGDGVGALSCIDAATGKPVWTSTKIQRSLSTVAVAKGLLFTADYAGFVHCLDAATGESLWTHDMKAHVWGSPLVADGRVWIGDEDGDLAVLDAAKVKSLRAEISFSGPIYSTPVAARGVLYIATPAHLFAFRAPK